MSEYHKPNAFHPDLPLSKMSMKRDSMQGNTLYSGLQTVAEMLHLIMDLLLHYPDSQQRIIHGSSKSNPFTTILLGSTTSFVQWCSLDWSAWEHLNIPCSVSNSLGNRIMFLTFSGNMKTYDTGLDSIISLTFLQRSGQPLNPAGSKGI